MAETTKSAVRSEVQKILTRSPAFAALPAEAQTRLAADMSRAAEAVLHAEDPQAAGREVAERLARVGEGPRAAEVRRVASGKEPGAAERRVEPGVEEVRRVESVTEPAFVAGVVRGVFEAVVDASIEQMRAYAELIAEATGGPWEFVKDRDPADEDECGRAVRATRAAGRVRG